MLCLISFNICLIISGAPMLYSRWSGKRMARWASGPITANSSPPRNRVICTPMPKILKTPASSSSTSSTGAFLAGATTTKNWAINLYIISWLLILFFSCCLRPILVLKSDQGFVGYKSGSSSNKLECNKANYEAIQVERGPNGLVYFKGSNNRLAEFLHFQLFTWI